MNFLSNRRLYRIGYVGPDEPNNEVVYEMIERSKVIHLAGS